MSFRMPLARLAGRIAQHPVARQSAATTGSPFTLARAALRQHQYHRRPYSSSQSPPPPPPPPSSNKIKFWPFFLIIGLGTAGYVALVNRRKGEMPATKQSQPEQEPSAGPTFNPSDVTVVFVLGGPGAGKGTQCARLVSEHGFTHLSAGDLLRAEQNRPGSQFGDLIRDYIKNGLIVPMEVTVKLLENAMRDSLAANNNATKGRFLIDGFPRKLDQAHKFEDSVCPAKLVLFFDCPEKVMESRLMERGKTSGRADDNAESIRKRFRTFIETSMPVVEYYEKQGKVVKVDATPAPEKVFGTTQKLLKEKLGASF